MLVGTQACWTHKLSMNFRVALSFLHACLGSMQKVPHRWNIYGSCSSTYFWNHQCSSFFLLNSPLSHLAAQSPIKTSPNTHSHFSLDEHWACLLTMYSPIRGFCAMKVDSWITLHEALLSSGRSLGLCFLYSAIGPVLPLLMGYFSLYWQQLRENWLPETLFSL